MTRFDAAALAWAVLLCLALGGAIPSVPAVLWFPSILAFAIFVLGFLAAIARDVASHLRNRR